MAKYDLYFNPPILNASGSLGFAPDLHGPVDLSKLGGFITNPVSLDPRSPAAGLRCLSFPGGFLLHTGHPNPGFSTVLKNSQPRWKRSPVPVLVHLLARGAEDIAYMVRRLESVEEVWGIELGLPPGVDPDGAAAIVRGASGELPVVVRLPFESASVLVAAAAAGGAAAVSLGAPRGALPGPDGKILGGRLYGPAVFPLAVAAVRSLAGCGVPIIASGGVYSSDQAAAMLAAGASAVQLDSLLWYDPGLASFSL